MRRAPPVRYLQAQAFVDRRERRASRRPVQRTQELDRTEQRGFSMSPRWTGRRPGRGPGRRSRTGPRHASPCDRAPRSCSPISKSANASGPPRWAPSPRKAAKDWNASAVSREKVERDKPVESCDADRGMMLWLSTNIMPRAWSILFSSSGPVVVTKSAPGTAICHEIADFGLEAPQLKPE